MTARLNPAHNPRRFPPCLPSSPSERPSPSSPSSASESSSKPERTAAALTEANSYRRSVFPLTGAQRTVIQLADAFTDLQDSRGADCIRAALDATADQAEHIAQQQKLIDVLLAEWKASNEYTREATLHGKAKAWRVRVDASVAVALALAEYRAAVQA